MIPKMKQDYSTLIALWKYFYCSPKRADSLEMDSQCPWSSWIVNFQAHWYLVTGTWEVCSGCESCLCYNGDYSCRCLLNIGVNQKCWNLPQHQQVPGKCRQAIHLPSKRNHFELFSFWRIAICMTYLTQSNLCLCLSCDFSCFENDPIQTLLAHHGAYRATEILLGVDAIREVMITVNPIGILNGKLTVKSWSNCLKAALSFTLWEGRGEGGSSDEILKNVPQNFIKLPPTSCPLQLQMSLLRKATHMWTGYRLIDCLWWCLSDASLFTPDEQWCLQTYWLTD